MRAFIDLEALITKIEKKAETFGINLVIFDAKQRQLNAILVSGTSSSGQCTARGKRSMTMDDDALFPFIEGVLDIPGQYDETRLHYILRTLRMTSKPVCLQSLR